MNRRFAFASILLAACCLGMTVSEVPDPMRTTGRFVQDAGGVLGEEYGTLIGAISRALERETTAELAIVTVDNLGGLSREEFAEQLFQKWKIGKRGKDNGVLILFARDDRQVWIEVGYGLGETINDAKAGRYLDAYAIPRFKEGQFGRGLYDLAKAVANEIAAASGATLDVTDPPAWPAQVSPPPPRVESLGARAGARIRGARGVWYTIGGFFGFGLLWVLQGQVRVRLAAARAAKRKALGEGLVFLILIWTFGLLLGMSLIPIEAELRGENEYDLMPLLGCLCAAGFLTIVQIVSRRGLKRYVANYRRACPRCKRSMQQVSEAADNQLLSGEEVAEEAAGGMNYEFWRCGKCAHTERLEVKLGGAGRCPKCGRRTLKETSTTITAATYDEGGKERVTRDCKNPTCKYHKEEVCATERKSRPSSGSSRSSGGGGSSGGSSFGGGSSGGGGAGRRW